MNQFVWVERGIRSSPFGLVEETAPGKFTCLVAVEVKMTRDRAAWMTLAHQSKDGQQNSRYAQCADDDRDPFHREKPAANEQ